MLCLDCQKVIHVLDLVGCDFKDPAGLFIRHDALQGRRNRLAQAIQRIGPRVVPHLMQGGLHGQLDPLHHGIEQVRLVLEMPVDRTACRACRRRDVIQRGA